MKKAILFFSIFCQAFLIGTVLNAQVIIGMEIQDECQPGTVNLYNYSDVGITGTPIWTWDINGMMFNDYEVLGLDLEAGYYDVSLTLYDDLGFQGSDYTSFEIFPDLDGFMSSSGGEACPGEPTNFWFDDRISPYDLLWTFGDNSVIEDQDRYNYPTHTFYEAGVYDVTLVIDHYCGPDTIVQQVTVGGSAKPDVHGYITNGPDFCPSDPVIFDVDRDYSSYLWTFGDGKTSTLKRPEHVYPTDTATTYQATVKVTNSCGNSDTDTLLVTFRDDLEAYAGFDYFFDSYSSYPCPGTPVEFNAWGAGIYEWDFGDGSSSNKQKAVNYYTRPGTYYVTLTVWNGCGRTDSRLDSVEVMLDPSDTPYADFYFEVEGTGGDEDWSDTIVVCPNMLVNFHNDTWSSSGASMSFEWDFGDGVAAFTKEASHVYTEASADPYPVTLFASNSCGGSDSLTKYVRVDADLMPDNQPGVTPLVICSGEEVFFYLEDGLEEGKYVIDIDFGDGTTLDNATTYADSILQTLANHVYTGAAGDTFNYVFSITNLCGNTVDHEGTIRITDDPGIRPFYYVDNSTSSGEGGPMEDWSYRRDASDHVFLIHFNWPGWPGGQDKFAVFFWYEGFDPEDDPGPVHGYVEFQTGNAAIGDSVKAYVPLNPLYPPIVGFAIGWSCDGVYKQGLEPEVWGMQFDFPGQPQTSFPLEAYGYTDMADVGDPVLLDADLSWDGICNDERPGRHYYYRLNAGQFIQLSFDRENNEYDLFATRDQEGYDYITDISYGDYYITGKDTMELTDWYNCAEMTGTYRYSISGDSLELSLISDFCTERVKYLTDSIFMKKPDFGSEIYDMSGCPGDKVRFTIAGGANYEWHFGDGSPVSNERYPVHVYTDPGDYNAFVIATNNCLRTDTIYTPVKIATVNTPYAYFWWEGYWERSRLEPIQFHPSDIWSDQAGNNSYLWNFGDGTNSTLREPVHAYERDGEYTISLTVTNGCGSSTESQMIFIKDAVLACEAKIGIDSVVGRTVYFRDISRGEITDWFWEFGDGVTSGEQDPVYTYDYDGIFFACLSVYDSINDCAHQVCRQVQIGTQNCIADFTAKVNTATNKVQFTDQSTNATEWFWDFGDGNFSDLKDPVHPYNEPGWYYVCLSIYNNASDCYAYHCMELQVGEEDSALCFADFSYFVDESSNTVIFTDASSTGITNWYWTFGDGTYMEDRNPVKTYKGPGIYEVCLIVFDKNTGCSDELCMEIPVGVSECNLRADFAFFVDISNSVASFSDRSVGQPTDWFWNFGDGATSSAQNPKHQYEDQGYYLVTLSVLNESNGCSDHVAEFIQIGTVDCRAAFEYKVDATTRNVQFYNKSTPAVAEYFWDFDDGTFSDEKDPMHQFSKPGLYFVSLTVVSGDGMCMDFFFEPIQVGTVTCAAEFKYFIDSATNIAYFTPEEIGSATAYLWFFGDGAISTGKTAQHRFTQPGYFTVGLNTFDETTGCMDYYEEVILIGRAGADCRAGFSYVSDPDTKTVKFGDRSKGNIVEYIWDFGDGQYSTEQNPVHPYAEGGYYLVCQTVVNTFGIPNTFCDFVQLATTDEESCFAEFFYSIDSATQTVEFMQESHGNPDEFLWNYDDGETSTDENPEHTYAEAGYYMVGLSIKNSTTNCSSRRFKLINVAEGNQGLKADFSYEVDSSDLKADTYPVDFVGVSLGDAGKLKWTFGDGTSDTTTLNPTHIYQVPGIYTACLIISNPITQDADTSCQEVTTPGYGVGIDPEAAWSERIGNYPNPFDQITYIVYDLLAVTSVDLVIYDQTGRLVDILVHEDQDAGRHELEYDGSKLDSGIYTLRLATDHGVYTARMVVR